MMLKKLGSITALSSAGAFLNFVTTYLIVKTLGLSLLGEFTVVTSITGLASLVYSILPANYSVFKYQDDKTFRFVFTAFYIYASFLYILILYLLFLYGVFNSLPLGIVVFNGITTIAFYYFDTIYQATNQLKKYFVQLLVQAIFKILIIVLYSYIGRLTTLSSLIFAVSLAQLLSICLFARDLSPNFKLAYSSPIVPILFIKNSFPDLRNYYLNAIIKRIKDNIIIVLFDNILLKNTLGLYTLFIKVTTFVLSLTRSFEAFFSNRGNLEKYETSFNKQMLRIALFMQFVFVVVGLVYMKIYTASFYFLEILVLSFLVFPYTKFLITRLKMLGKYNNKEINISMGVYIGFVLISFVICATWNLVALRVVLGVYFVSELLNYSYLIYSSFTSSNTKTNE